MVNDFEMVVFEFGGRRGGWMMQMGRDVEDISTSTSTECNCKGTCMHCACTCTWRYLEGFRKHFLGERYSSRRLRRSS